MCDLRWPAKEEEEEMVLFQLTHTAADTFRNEPE